jgi:hypothetical protein
MVTHLPDGILGKLIRSWQFWTIATMGTCGGLAFMAINSLYNPRSTPNCPEMFTPWAAVSMRLYCGQLAAAKQTLPDLVSALNLVKDVPADDPLSTLIDQNIQMWSQDILRLGEKSFQAGKLQEAVDTAEKIPPQVAASKLAQQKIKAWKETWRRAEEIYARSEKMLRSSQWVDGYREAVKLTTLNNNYWGTVKYQELADAVQQGKADSAKLDGAHKKVKSVVIKDLLEAIGVAQKINSRSYAYKEAQDLIAAAGAQMLILAKNEMKKNQPEAALTITKQIPSIAKINSEVKELTSFLEAKVMAAKGGIGDLETAISLMQNVANTSPYYSESQQLVSRWRIEVQDVATLQRAKSLASGGTPRDYLAAIEAARQIPGQNPRAAEAAKLVAEYQKQIQVVEDRPFLDAADRAAAAGDINSLRQGIAQIQRIQPGRALYKEAQDKARTWLNRIQEIEDSPILASAEQQAQQGQLASAIAIANQIQPGRYLHARAQGKIRGWQADSTAEQTLNAARNLASQNTAEALLGAIRAVQKIPRESQWYDRAKVALDGWSSQLLQIASNLASQDRQRAIAIAKVIPSGTSAYKEAQELIANLSNLDNPNNILPSPQDSAPVPLFTN